MPTDDYVKMINELETLLKEAKDSYQKVTLIPELYSYWQGKIAGLEQAVKIVKSERA